MFKIKFLTGLLLIATVLFAQVGTVAAAPQAQTTTTITGTIQSISLETDTLSVTTVLVTLVDNTGATQTVHLSVDTAVGLGLVTVDPTTNQPVVDETKYGQTIDIDPTTVITNEEPVEESYHPIAELLATFFGEDTSVIDGYHEDGFGFGLIAQSLWMSQNLGGDATIAGQILEAKQTGDYSAFTLPDGSTLTNWGQFKKAISEKKNNLGVVVSGHADDDTTEEQLQPGNGQGNSNNNKDKNNNGKGKDK